MPKKKSISKVKKKAPKKTKAKKKIKHIKKKVLKKIEEKELIIKTKPEWVKNALINKTKYQKNTLTRLKKMMIFGRLREKELLGLNHIKKLRT